MKEKGFTLIELVVVIGIIAVLAFTFSVNYRGGEKEFALKRSAHLVAQGIAKAQEMSISAKEFDCPGETTVPPGGYGVYFTSWWWWGVDGVVIFADCNGDHLRNSPGEDVEIIYLEEGITLKGLYLEGSYSYSIFLTFIPPDPTVCFMKDCSDYSFAEIVIALESDQSKTKTISVNRVGLIEIE